MLSLMTCYLYGYTMPLFDCSLPSYYSKLSGFCFLLGDLGAWLGFNLYLC